MENLQEQINTTDMVQHNFDTGLNPHIRDINSKLFLIFLLPLSSVCAEK